MKMPSITHLCRRAAAISSCYAAALRYDGQTLSEILMQPHSGATSPSPSQPHASASSTAHDAPAVEKLKLARETLLREISKVIVGQTEVVDLLLTAMFSR